MDLSSEEDKVATFCEVSGIESDRARFLLRACNFDLQTALNYHLEVPSDLGNAQMLDTLDHLPEISVHPVTVRASTSNESSCASTAGPSTSEGNFRVPQPPAPFAHPTACGDDRPIRAPLVPREDILIDSAEALVLNRRPATKRGGSSIFDSFRDFRVEGNRQEELVQGNNSADQKMRRLEDIFRPPLDLMFHGSFQEARDTGVLLKKFVMVNIQNPSEFCCQVLNRDIWSDPVVKMLVSENFVFWQVFHDTLEGSVYCSFYNATDYPYISIIDPRTGELVHKWNQIVLTQFIEEILHFLQENPHPFAPVAALAALASDATGPGQCDDAVGACSPRTNGKNDEEKQGDCRVGSSDEVEDSEEVVSDSTDDENVDVDGNGKTVKIRLQYPDQSRELFTFPITKKIKCLQRVLRKKGFPPNKFQYVTYMPKRALNKSVARDQSFQSLDMVGNESVYVHPVTHKDDTV